MSRLDDLRLNVDALLTAMAQGFQPIGFVGHLVLPTLAAPSDSVMYPIFGKESFMIPDTRRALRAMPIEVDFAADDRREQAAGMEVGIDYQRQALFTARRAVEMGRELEVATLVQDTSIYDASHVIAVTNPWDTPDGTPVEDITAGVEVISDSIGGMTPNSLTIHRKTWNAIRTNPNVLAFATETIGPVKRITTDVFAQLIEVENIYIANSFHSQDGETFSPVWDKQIAVLSYAAPSTGGQMDTATPSFGFNLQRQYGTAMDGELPLYGISGSFDTEDPFISRSPTREPF